MVQRGTTRYSENLVSFATNKTSAKIHKMTEAKDRRDCRTNLFSNLSISMVNGNGKSFKDGMFYLGGADRF